MWTMRFSDVCWNPCCPKGLQRHTGLQKCSQCPLVCKHFDIFHTPSVSMFSFLLLFWFFFFLYLCYLFVLKYWDLPLESKCHVLFCGFFVLKHVAEIYVAIFLCIIHLGIAFSYQYISLLGMESPCKGTSWHCFLLWQDHCCFRCKQSPYTFSMWCISLFMARIHEGFSKLQGVSVQIKSIWFHRASVQPGCNLSVLLQRVLSSLLCIWSASSPSGGGWLL